MAKPTYDNAPDAPSRQAPATFRTRMDAFLAWMPGFKTFVDDANTHIDTQLSGADTAASNASSSASAASSSASSAASSATLAQRWANEDEDVDVTPGNKSALHHAAKAEEFKDSAETAAAAAGAAAGLPSFAGNANKALIVNPTADGVLWGTAGGLVPLSKHEVTSTVAALEFTIPSSGYARIVVLFNGITGTHADAEEMYVRTSSDGGTSFDTGSSYAYRVGGNNSTSDTKAIVMFSAQVPGNGFNLDLSISGLSATDRTRMHITNYGSVSNVDYEQVNGIVERTTADETNALQFYFQSGDITGGTAHVYGIVEGDA